MGKRINQMTRELSLIYSQMREELQNKSDYYADEYHRKEKGKIAGKPRYTERDMQVMMAEVRLSAFNSAVVIVNGITSREREIMRNGRKD